MSVCSLEVLPDAKAKALAIFFCLLFDEGCDLAQMFDSLVDAASAPEVARHLLRIIDLYGDIDIPLDEMLRIAREDAETPRMTIM